MTNASRKVDAFEKHYKESPGHIALAYHAAFPLALTPDMLYRLAAYFQTDCEGRPLRIPWIAVADILLSPFCEEIDDELYEIVPDVRVELLRRLEAHEKFGPARLKQLADFLLTYAQQHLHRHNPALMGKDLSTVREAQLMVAQANRRPDLAVEQLAAALAMADLNNSASLLRYSRLTDLLTGETPMQMAEGVEKVKLYAQGLEQIGRKNPDAAARRFAEAAAGEMEVQVGNLSLPIPVPAHRGLNFPEFFLHNPVQGDTEIITHFGDLLNSSVEGSEGIRIARQRDGRSEEQPPSDSTVHQSAAAQSEATIGSQTGSIRQRPLVILAAQRGEVVEVHQDVPAQHRLGRYVRIRHDWPVGDTSETWYTWYCDLLNIEVREGDFVLPNQQIGTVGTFEANVLRFIVQHSGAGLSGYALEDVVDPEPLFFEGDEPPVVDECRVVAPDTTAVEPGQRFTFRWTVQNIGNTAWRSGYQFAFANGEQMDGPDSTSLRRVVEPGGWADVELSLIAPEKPGQYQGVWRPRTPNGFFFPTALTADVEVTAEMPTMDGMVIEDTQTEILKGQVGDKGYEFEVTWRLRNIGLRAWNRSFTLVQTTPTPLQAGYNSGYTSKSSDGSIAFAGGEHIWRTELTEIHMPEVEPGDEMTLRMPFTAPETHGFFESKWQLFNPEGRAIGEKLIVSASVGTATKYTDLGLLLSDSEEVGEELLQELALLRPYVMKIYSTVRPGLAHRLAADYPKARWIIQPYTDRPTTPRELVSETLGQIKALVDALSGREVWLELNNEPNIPSQPFSLIDYTGEDFAKWFLEVKGQFRETLGPDVRFIYPSRIPGFETPESKFMKGILTDLKRTAELNFLESSRPALDEAEAIGQHLEWRDAASMTKALDRLDKVLDGFPEKQVWVTMANNYDSQLSPEERGQQFVNVWRQLQKRPQVEGIVFFLGQTSNPDLEPFAWAGKGIAEIVGRRYDDGAGLVEDVRMRFGGTAAVGKRITKEWKIQNIGRSTWNNDYRLAVVEGEGWQGAASYSTQVIGRTGDEAEVFAFSSGYQGPTDSQMTITAVPMPDVAPGEIVAVSLSLDVPPEPGSYAQSWQLFSERGLAFGEKWRFEVSAVEMGTFDLESHTDAVTIIADGYMAVYGDIIGRNELREIYELDQKISGAVRELEKLLKERLPAIRERIAAERPQEGTGARLYFDGSGPLEVHGDIIYRDHIEYQISYPFDAPNAYDQAAMDVLERLLEELELLERWWSDPLPMTPPVEADFSGELFVNGDVDGNVTINGHGGRTEINGNILNPNPPSGLLSLDLAGELLVNGNIYLGDVVTVHFSESWDEELAGLTAEPEILSLETLLRRVDELEKRVQTGRATEGGVGFREQEPPPTEMPVDNFDLRVSKEGDRYFVRASYSQGGETESAVYGENLFENELVRSFLVNLERSTSDPHQVQEVGQLMREWLFPPEIWSFFISARMNSRERHNRGLRIRLRIEPPEIAVLPWEYCFDIDFDFLALRRDLRLVRYIDRPHNPDDISPQQPVRLLLAAAGPSDLKPIDVTAETDNIFQVLQPLVASGELEISRLEHATLDGLQTELHRFRPHILHFIGHGIFDNDGVKSAITLENEDGTTRLLSFEQLARLLLGTGVKVIFLNAPNARTRDTGNAFMGLAPALVRSGIPAVITIPYALPNETAVHFARQIYQYMVRGLPLDRAISEARINTFAYDDTFWGVPVLFMASSDGVIWQERAEEIYEE